MTNGYVSSDIFWKDIHVLSRRSAPPYPFLPWKGVLSDVEARRETWAPIGFSWVAHSPVMVCLFIGTTDDKSVIDVGPTLWQAPTSWFDGKSGHGAVSGKPEGKFPSEKLEVLFVTTVDAIFYLKSWTGVPVLFDTWALNWRSFQNISRRFRILLRAVLTKYLQHASGTLLEVIEYFLLQISRHQSSTKLYKAIKHHAPQIKWVVWPSLLG